MSRKKEIVEVNESAVETIGVEDAFIEDTAQEEEVDGREEGLDSEIESGGEEPGDMADDADNPEEDTLADFMEEENVLMESAEDAEEAMSESDEMEQDTDGEDVRENGEDGGAVMMEEASDLTESATEPEAVPAETAAAESVSAKPKRSSRKKKAVSDKAENEAEATGEQSDVEIGVQPELEAQPGAVPEEGLLVESPFSAEETVSGMAEDSPDMDADYSDALTLDSENPEDVDEWDEAYGEAEEESVAGSAEAAIEETAEDVDEISAVAKREAPPSIVSEKRPADSAPRRAAGGDVLYCHSGGGGLLRLSGLRCHNRYFIVALFSRGELFGKGCNGHIINTRP